MGGGKWGALYRSSEHDQPNHDMPSVSSSFQSPFFFVWFRYVPLPTAIAVMLNYLGCRR